MHDRCVIIVDAAAVYRRCRLFSKVVFKPWLHIAPDDLDKLVSVRARLLVVQSEGVADLVQHHSFLN